jgi:hypothetical protein
MGLPPGGSANPEAAEQTTKPTLAIA